MTSLPDRRHPVWLLDVDGVINANRPGWGGAPRSAHAYADGEGYRMRWAPALIDRIRALHTSRAVEVRWATSWVDHATQLERLFGLPPLTRALADGTPGPHCWALKVAAARGVLAAGHRLVWTDDEVTPRPGSPLWDELTADGRALFITPDPRRGLQPDHLDTIEAFLQAEVPA